jgi:F0F1-type ATP synthase membrane subunit b/b'
MGALSSKVRENQNYALSSIIEKSRKLEAEIVARLGQAQNEADEIVLIAHKEAERMKGWVAARADEAEQKASEIIRSATQEANSLKLKIINDPTLS